MGRYKKDGKTIVTPYFRVGGISEDKWNEIFERNEAVEGLGKPIRTKIRFVDGAKITEYEVLTEKNEIRIFRFKNGTLEES